MKYKNHFVKMFLESATLAFMVVRLEDAVLVLLELGVLEDASVLHKAML